MPIVKVFHYAVYSVVWAFALEPEAGFTPADHSFSCCVFDSTTQAWHRIRISPCPMRGKG